MKQQYKDKLTVGQLIKFLSGTDLNATVEFEQKKINQIQFSKLKNIVNFGRDPIQISRDLELENASEAELMLNQFNSSSKNLHNWFITNLTNYDSNILDDRLNNDSVAINNWDDI